MTTATRRPPYTTQAILERLVAQLAVTLNNRALYGSDHASFEQSARDLIDTLRTACVERRQDSVTLLVFDDDLVVDQWPLRRGGPHQQPVIRALKRRRIERLTIAYGMAADECERLIEALAVGGVPASSPHVVVGRLELADSPADPEAESDESGIGQAIEMFRAFRATRRLDVSRLDSLVWGFVDQLTRSTTLLLPLVPLKTHDEYTFVHSVNVSLLTLAQARSLGIRGAALHAIGLAALLHDLGKHSIPLAVLNKPGKLEGEEWKIITTHPEIGARQLCQMEGAPSLAVLVAYEHHLRFDGQPSYPVLRTARRPTLASQLTAIADVYDAIATARPYKKALARETAFDVLRSRVGTFHDPYLVGNFLRLIGETSPASETAAGS